MPTIPIPAGTGLSDCRGCGAPIYFVRTKNGKPIPISVNTTVDATCLAPTATNDGAGVAHFADCPDAMRFRRSRSGITRAKRGGET